MLKYELEIEMWVWYDDSQSFTIFSIMFMIFWVHKQA